MKRILFIGHSAGRSGAPLILLYLLRWLRANVPEFRADLLLLDGGELLSEFREVANVTLVHGEQPSIFDRILRRIVRPDVSKDTVAARVAGLQGPYDVVVGNTIVSLEYLEYFKRTGARTVCWIHELDYVVKLSLGDGFKALAESVDEFIVPSLAVGRMLDAYGLEGPRHLVRELFESVEASDGEAAAARRELAIPADAFVVGGAGTIEWRKGVDLFLRLAAMAERAGEDLRFVWVGGTGDRAEELRAAHDIERLALGGRVTMAGVKSNPGPYFAAMDVLALTSREDPFPIVCMEAASLGKPVLCFADAGGIPEFVRDDAGATVPYGDLDAMLERILYFRDNPAARLRAGEVARARQAGEFSADESYAALRRVILGTDV